MATTRHAESTLLKHGILPGARRTGRLIAAGLAAAWLGLAGAAAARAPAGAQDAAPDAAAVRARMGAISIPFVENTGQLDGRVRYKASLFSGTLFVTGGGELAYALDAGRAPAPTPERAAARAPEPGRSPPLAFTERFVGGRARPAAGTAHAARVNSFIGPDPARHRSGIRTFENVALGEVYAGIDVRLRATGANVEKIFTLRPHADVAAIRVAVDGATGLALAADGSLRVTTDRGEAAFTAPVAYQTIDGVQSPVAVAYALAPGDRGYGFTVGEYDHSRPLVIDPFLQSIYAGGNGGDIIHAIAIHPSTGEIYAAGSTAATDFPETGSGAFPAYQSGLDGFIARYNAQLTQLLGATYIGGTGEDGLFAIAISPLTGDVYVAGNTRSTDFPMASNPVYGTHAADQSNQGYRYDGVIARLSQSLGTLAAATYFGGNLDDEVDALAIAPGTGDVYAVGYSKSASLPKTAGGAVDAFGAWFAAGFAARFDASLHTHLQTTYLPPSGSTLYLYAATVHPALGTLYVAGYGGSGAAVIGQVAPTLQSGLSMQYISGQGGVMFSQFFSLAVHPATGDLYVAGRSTDPGLPATNGSAQAALNGSENGIVARFTPSPLRLQQLTYYGGSGSDGLFGLAIHPATGEIYVVGQTSSNDLPAKVFGAQTAHASYPGPDDGMVARFTPDLTSVLQATYLGGPAIDELTAIAIHPATGDVIVAGYTTSTAFPQTSGSEYPNHVADATYDGVLTRISADLTLADTTPNAIAFQPQYNVAPGTLRVSNPQQVTGIGGPASLSVGGQPGSAFAVSSGPNCSGNVSGGFVTTAGFVASGNYVCARHLAAAAPNQVTRTDVRIGPTIAPFISTTGTLIAGGCTLDVDGNGAQEALTDGLMILRAMFGLTGTSVTSNAIGNGATRGDWTAVRAYLNGNCGSSFAP